MYFIGHKPHIPPSMNSSAHPVSNITVIALFLPYHDISSLCCSPQQDSLSHPSSCFWYRAKTLEIASSNLVFADSNRNFSCSHSQPPSLHVSSSLPLTCFSFWLPDLSPYLVGPILCPHLLVQIFAPTCFHSQSTFQFFVPICSFNPFPAPPKV